MLREYQLTNFKAFAGPETIPIRPITLIYGPNSSGKSSVLQSLLLLKQTLQEAENPETLLLPKGNLVNLGGYREFIHRHDVSKSFSFKVVFDVGKQGKPNPLENLLREKLIQAPLLGLQVAFSYDKQTSNVVFSSVELFLEDESYPVVIYKPEKQEVLEIERAGSREIILKVDNINYDYNFWKAWFDIYGSKIAKNALAEVNSHLKQKNSRASQLQSKKKKEQLEKLEKEITELIQLKKRFDNYKFKEAIEDFSKAYQHPFIICRNFLPVTSDGLLVEKLPDPEIRYLFQDHRRHWLPDVLGVTLQACSMFRRFLESLIYIGPLRDYPERLYILSGNSSQQVGKSGKMVSDILFRNPELLKQVNEQLERFGLEYELKVASYTNKETSELSDVFALRLVDKYTHVNVSLLDVGFGISQVLPIIVQSMLSRNTTLLIEQPEIHIHPRLQAELGSLLAECIKPPLNNQFIIETHSEHLMLRLQKLIRKGELKPEDVSVIYVDRGAEGSKCLHLRLDEEGDFIDEWPGGFFEEDFNEIFQ
ncbi:AAA family ATPase [Aerosakkonema funiforme]|uniref:DUF3696 domain-containing protein n=3 Tax=Oscillatoriophycideae TaxID=1301283 RepID=A0A926ZKT0_9CYAN|nr:DUF3696 domain-containing protein [Aerosakkonema funiforme]MBD2184326.1 DUF3696 domain-containing protein [Aerosakkonema funiforme FACHB-1375]